MQKKQNSQKKRIIYKLKNVEFDIDTWPMIPTYMEIEGKNKEMVLDMIKLLNIPNEKLTLDKVSEIYKKYGIDIHEYKNLIFQIVLKRHKEIILITNI